MTATIVSFDASDSAAAKVQLETLAPGGTDKIVTWFIGTKCFVAKVTVQRFD